MIRDPQAFDEMLAAVRRFVREQCIPIENQVDRDDLIQRLHRDQNATQGDERQYEGDHRCLRPDRMAFAPSTGFGRRKRISLPVVSLNFRTQLFSNLPHLCEEKLIWGLGADVAGAPIEPGIANRRVARPYHKTGTIASNKT